MDGILIVDKPEGITSHDVVDFLRRRFGVGKVGHAGTLDPAASGLLVMLLGKLTRSSNQFINDDKEYEVVVRLGERRDTLDREGKVTSVSDPGNLSEETIIETLKLFEGEQEQLPPMYSAVKHKGKKLYELARSGKVVERKPRSIKIHKIKISYIRMPDVKFDVLCSKGTYVRQLASDIGDKLGCGAYVYALRRTRSGKFLIKNAVTMKGLEAMDARHLTAHLI